ncbi:transposase-like protein [Rhizobium sp. BK538]|nr:transposase-like protein [Rhizobium sp. BK060]MBB4170748.1 transposase-like protein [Rhizobium sp. BK538]TCM75981.1 mutator family transposase [Rhizobium sp. BK068]
MPQDRSGRFSTELFERYQRSEQALVSTLVEMYVQGVSTRKVKAITEELCGHAFSASAISAISKRLDESLKAFAKRLLPEPFPYLIHDARYEKVREAGVVRSQAVLIAIGIDWDGRCQVLAVEMANRESSSSWKDFLLGLTTRGLHGVESVVADDHAGLRAAIREVLNAAAHQRCYVHFLRNALDDLPCKADDDCLQELRWIYDRRDLAEARADLAQWLGKWQGKYPRLTDWVDETKQLPAKNETHLSDFTRRVQDAIVQEPSRRYLFASGDGRLANIARVLFSLVGEQSGPHVDIETTLREWWPRKDATDLAHLTYNKLTLAGGRPPPHLEGDSADPIYDWMTIEVESRILNWKSS